MFFQDIYFPSGTYNFHRWVITLPPAGMTKLHGCGQQNRQARCGFSRATSQTLIALPFIPTLITSVQDQAIVQFGCGIASQDLVSGS